LKHVSNQRWIDDKNPQDEALQEAAKISVRVSTMSGRGDAAEKTIARAKASNQYRSFGAAIVEGGVRLCSVPPGAVGWFLGEREGAGKNPWLPQGFWTGTMLK
jgi:hypothetical protein